MKLGFLQMRSKFGETKTNVKKASSLLSKVSDATIILPELFNTGYLFKNRAELMGLAENITKGYTVSEMKKVAKKKRLNLVFGMAQKSGSKVFNSAVYISQKGKVEVYQKVHLFDREKLFFNPGTALKTVSTGEGVLGLMVCFDWAFPEVSRILTLKGAQILAHPANLILPWGQQGMTIRSIENGVFSVTANRVGIEKRGTMSLTFTGGSQIVSPRGEVLVSAGDRSESLKVIDIEVEQADDKNITSANHLIEDRFPALYAPIAKKGKRR
ncbi:MAG TPA: nitrilase-related carbon-nitrogen hydrolase [Candidatus Krumholzibacterium sp.]|nr:nitrilase-related carbon-nitrogen hydrolase [Candidatus Krumholzibacterium sp.]